MSCVALNDLSMPTQRLKPHKNKKYSKIRERKGGGEESNT
jgi:hypothetical protein